jgi:hypothetical protein
MNNRTFMNGRSRVILAACFMLLSLSCSHRLERAEQSSAFAQSVPHSQASSISPSRCSILGTVVESDTLITRPYPLCLVRIDSVLGYGSSFSMPLSTGQNVHVYIVSFARDPARAPADSLGHPVIFAGSKLKGELERNAVDGGGDNGKLNFTMYDAVVIE